MMTKQIFWILPNNPYVDVEYMYVYHEEIHERLLNVEEAM